MMYILRRRRSFCTLLLVSFALFFVFSWYTMYPDKSSNIFFRKDPMYIPQYQTEFETPLRPNNIPDDRSYNGIAQGLEYSEMNEIHMGNLDDKDVDVVDFYEEKSIRSISPEMKFRGKDISELLNLNPESQEKMGKLAIAHSSKSAALQLNSTKKLLILDTPGCEIPKFDPFDPTIADLFEAKTERYDCGSNATKVFLIGHPNATITLNETALYTFYNLTKDILNCSYEPIYRFSQETAGNFREENYGYHDAVPLEFGVPIKDDYIKVTCDLYKYNDTDTKKLEHYFPFVHIKDEIEQTKNNISGHNPKLNVILIGIDSISKLNYLRHFTRTHKLLEDYLSPFDMKGYVKVGDNTFPNLVPLLTGNHVEHYYTESQENITFFDHLDFIWKHYSKRGYRTLFAEDHPYAGTFNFNKRGFRDPPTDYYYRPIASAMDYTKYFLDQHICLNSETDTDMIYSYLNHFITVMDQRPLFAFTMTSTITHDVLNNAGHHDFPTVRLLEDIYSSGVLNRSMLVLFSDHGIRYGAINERFIGKFEERMPFMFIHIPEWFLRENPRMAENLRTNQDRLTTLFDVHATMLHLLGLNDEEPSLGSSLLEEISPNRTCEVANIQPHYCPCLSLEEVSHTDPNALTSSDAILNHMNRELSPHKLVCAELELETISDARVSRVSADLLWYGYTDYTDDVPGGTYREGAVSPMMDYLITLTAKPCGGVFEGTVRHDVQNGTFDVQGISRINRYGNQSSCIDSPKLKLYCCCGT